MHQKLAILRDNLNCVLNGKPETVDLVIICIASAGHLLLEDVPGVGKTTLAKAVASSIQADFRRIQFTPDLLPTDIVGCSIFNPKEGEFYLRKGPVFTHVLLADEINRASPRTQSALLESMNEHQVSIEGTTHSLPAPFIVIATQNPVEYQGTYPLPEAQLDRFAMQLSIGYPSHDADLQILNSHRVADPLDSLRPALSREDLVSIQAAVRRIDVHPDVADYAVKLIRSTREDRRIRLGASPRAMISLMRCAQAKAYLDQRSHVLPEDLKALAVPVLSHRLTPDNRTQYSGTSKAALTAEIIQTVTVPR